MPTHGHGQGYADTNFIIPETIERVEVTKGPYCRAATLRRRGPSDSDERALRSKRPRLRVSDRPPRAPGFARSFSRVEMGRGEAACLPPGRPPRRAVREPRRLVALQSVRQDHRAAQARRSVTVGGASYAAD
jgi:hypothetical protein